jgi:ice-binding like protein/exosortase sorting signal-containing protein
MTTQTASVTPFRHGVPPVAEAGRRFSRNHHSLLAGAGFAAFLLVCAPALSQVLGTASNFAVLGSTPNVTNTGNSVISGNVGVSPALSITGFPPGLIVPGTGFLHPGDLVAAQARADTTAAYLVLAGLGPASPIPVQLGGQVLGPGVYAPLTGGAFDLTGTLTLTGPGLYVFQMTAGLTTASGPGASSVVLQGGFSPCDVWWQVGSSAAIGTFSLFQGNILALTSITIATSASLQGRALARNGTVTLDANTVTACSGGTAPGFLVAAPAAVPPIFANVGIPTLSQWTMVILAALLAIAGIAALRRRAR